MTMAILLKNMTIFVNFFEKKSSFWHFFDFQMAIFRRVRYLPHSVVNPYDDLLIGQTDRARMKQTIDHWVDGQRTQELRYFMSQLLSN